VENQHLVSLLQQCSSTPVSSGEGFLSKNNLSTLEHPPYSPALAPAYSYLFPQLKSALKGHRFCNAAYITKNATEELKRLPQNGFQKGFQHHYSP